MPTHAAHAISSPKSLKRVAVAKKLSIVTKHAKQKLGKTTKSFAINKGTYVSSYHILAM